MLKLIWIVFIKTRLNEKVQKPEPCFNENKTNVVVVQLKATVRLK